MLNVYKIQEIIVGKTRDNKNEGNRNWINTDGSTTRSANNSREGEMLSKNTADSRRSGRLDNKHESLIRIPRVVIAPRNMSIPPWKWLDKRKEGRKEGW